MKSKTKYLMVALAAMLALIMARPCAAAVTANSLSLTYNSTTYTTGMPTAVNANGQVAGTVTDASGTTYGCLWTDGTPTVIPNASVDVSGESYDYDDVNVSAMNDSGQFVGYSMSKDGDTINLEQHATLWKLNSAGTSYIATDLGVAPQTGVVNPYTESYAEGIDNQGRS